MRHSVLLLFLTLALTACSSTKKADVSSVSPGVDAPPVIVTAAALPGEWAADRIVLNGAVLIAGNVLELSAAYSGGCREHTVQLVAANAFMETVPPRISVLVSHDSQADPCDSWETRAYRFDLRPLKSLYQSQYRRETGRLILQLQHDGEALEITYSF